MLTARGKSKDERPPPDHGEVLFKAERGRPGQQPEVFEVSVKEYQGRRYVDLRMWWKGLSGDWLPGKKGISIRATEIEGVIRALNKAAEILAAPEPQAPASRQGDVPF